MPTTDDGARTGPRTAAGARLAGVDATRGLAVLGMFAAHVGAGGPDFWSGDGWLQVADGRSAATFALLAGLSAALLSGGPTPPTGQLLRYARVRILARAAMLLPLGAFLVLLRTPVAVILPAYAVMFALLTPFLRVPPRWLLAVAAAVAVVGPAVALAARGVAGTGDALLPPVDVLVGEHYPVVVWFAYLLVGLAVGRQDLGAPTTARRLAVVGAVALVAGYGTAAAAMRALPADAGVLRALLTAEPHADTLPEVVGNVGVALLVLAVSLAAARRVPALLTPLAATGALALTAYVVHVVAIAVLGDEAVWGPGNGDLVAFVVVTLALTTAWQATLGRGPLERVLHAVSGVVAAAAVEREPVRPAR
ncbi:heparan-alpha-glucosaminide N-acetyltransferase domain-containing protein [Actinotalea sp. Marseille-Q4924]|uniref:heparan-alpha-glucosaminide N-acetyltransferase domain-containing protein n=1 Tax=Actinotalea sp. Marseille-Q4924 TaxID=2866571 RepID=UPI001CE4B505|nr:heparan-alpha-glucosaminide N-acetyltransferase domain-containing protein [Actinotalea sp. Marseille-Q4924]